MLGRFALPCVAICLTSARGFALVARFLIAITCVTCCVSTCLRLPSSFSCLRLPHCVVLLCCFVVIRHIALRSEGLPVGSIELSEKSIERIRMTDMVDTDEVSSREQVKDTMASLQKMFKVGVAAHTTLS